jgi:hypothetical protein
VVKVFKLVFKVFLKLERLLMLLLRELFGRLIEKLRFLDIDIIGVGF